LCAPPRKLIPRIPSRCPGQLYKVPHGEILAQACGGPGAYSSRSATIGSTLAARRAGMTQAASAMAVNTTPTRMNVLGS